MWNIKSFFSKFSLLLVYAIADIELSEQYCMLQLAKENRLPPQTLHPCLQRIYSRPEGAPALCDDPSELGQPPGIHLKPLQWVIPPSTPGPIIEVIFIEASLWANNRFLFHKSMWSSLSPRRSKISHLLRPSVFIVLKFVHYCIWSRICINLMKSSLQFC